ncbi:triosephosphate isomerase [Spongiibacter sp. IMCC21906]|jgi:triosephosphate isomerase|uniref:triose-phosphate isomerase n=1 Tax=Spongiibacter sp. IMCC21906 TaxID=1620392 RepID=UPI00062E0A91|nr:triose-phosphate isomerase [Spongiibacter sp. IMCC21906]AKH70765.1 triosephosphate isomerase [Spongiibacter sp. IMCC21906]
MRSFLVAGNWKMHGDSAGIKQLLSELLKALPAEPGIDIAVFPPAVYLAQVAAEMAATPVAVGAQNVCAQAGPGAYTGEISAAMLTDVGCQYVLVGHSERRSLYGESSQLVAEKAKAALTAGLIPVVCVGESEAQRDEGQTLEVISSQLVAVFAALTAAELKKIVVAYEPVWAIGTGKTASPEQAQEVHGFIRALFAKQDEALANELRILYGGSVKANNAATLFAQADIDGGLVGGASLDAQEFSAICRAAE